MGAKLLGREDATDRFVARTKKVGNGCIEWQGSRNERGYGQTRGKFILRDATEKAHRLAFVLFVGPIPEGLHVLHDCDNPACVNPVHLFLGTHTDNMQDMTTKGRGRPTGGKCKGEKHWGAKLNEADVKAIRTAYATGKVTQQQLADQYKVYHTTISAIILRTRWAHVA